jgi:hypothetical protein
MEIYNRLQKQRVTQIRFEPVGWKSLLQIRGGSSRILILKSVVRGLCLNRGQSVYSYVGEDPSGRPVMVSYLDGHKRVPAEGGYNGEKEPEQAP